MSGFSTSAPKPFSFCSPGLRKLLLRKRVVSEEQMNAISSARAMQSDLNCKILAALAVNRLIEEDQIIALVAEDLSLSVVDLREPAAIKRTKTAGLTENLDADLLLRHRCLPLEVLGNEVVVALADPLDTEAISALEFMLGWRTKVVLARESDIVALLNRITGERIYREAAKDEGRDSGDHLPGGASSAEGDETLQLAKSGAETAPVVQLVNRLLMEALELKASDVHLEPSGDSLEVRFRVDGVMAPYITIPKQLQSYVLTRLKILAGMDITIKRRPQDGRFVIRNGQQECGDARASAIPTPYGEKIVLRLLRSNQEVLSLGALGMPAEVEKAFKNALAARDCMVVVTGPTGSGKSTTLYAALNYLREGTTNIITVEDPIEYRIEGITQIQVDQKSGMTFANSLRSILRQDPDIIMVGEIRDRETAEIGFQAAQTGHLVLSTLHTNTAASAAIRLVDLGIEPFIITSSLGAVLSQRLVRRVCSACALPLSKEESYKLRANYAIEPQQAKKGAGCRECGRSGYRGRIGVYSLLIIDHAIGELIRKGAAEREIEQAAASHYGFQSLFEAGSTMVEQGLTTVEELERVVGHGEASPLTQTRGKRERTFTSAFRQASVERKVLQQERPIETVADLLDSFAGVHCPQSRLPEAEPDMARVSAAPAESFDSVASLAQAHRERGSSKAAAARVLLVDDDEGVRAVVSRALKKNDFEVCEAVDGWDALQKVSTFGPDLIVSDLIMPRLDGEQFVKQLRANESTQSVPVLVLTGSDDEESEVKLLEAGATDFISKSASPAVLLARIKRMLSSYSKNQALT